MTAAQLLKDLRAQHAARRDYRRYADRLWEEAQQMHRDGWRGWAREVERMAMVAERAAQAER